MALELIPALAPVQPSAVNGAQAVDGIVVATVVSVAYQCDTVAVSDRSSWEIRDVMKEGDVSRQ